MKKHIAIIIAGCLILSGIAQAGTEKPSPCADGAGYLYIGNSNEQNSYCVSNALMNWWSAFTWCEKAGGTLADVNSDCACTGNNCPTDRSCPNLRFTDRYTYMSSTSYAIWTRNEYVQNTQQACVVGADGGMSCYSSKTSRNLVICKM